MGMSMRRRFAVDQATITGLTRLGPDSIQPNDALHALQRKGYLRSRLQGVGRRARRLYRATKKGHKALHFAKVRVHELFGELFEGRRSGRRI